MAPSYDPSPAELDASDPLSGFRNEFWIPTALELDSENVAPNHELNDTSHSNLHDPEQATYLCGNSLGLQPKATSAYVNAQLRLWRSKGVYGHFKQTNSLIPPWVDIDEAALQPMARIVGARPSEVAIMQTLSANLHILMSSFYKPDTHRNKILIEAKSFPSDHFIVESQLKHHGVDPHDGIILLQPPSADSLCIPTEHTLKMIDSHASEIALILLPGIQFYTGQFFDIERITRHAHGHGITIGWDLAHAVGNVPLMLHEWNVDFAAWCNYKYMNSGPGSIGSLFVHSRHTDNHDMGTSNSGPQPKSEPLAKSADRSRLQGWWGSTKASRFTMDNVFDAMPGAAGFQLSNPSVLDISALLASLSTFGKTTVAELRAKSIRLTGYLEQLLFENTSKNQITDGSAGHSVQHAKLYRLITPDDPAQRGAQLSLQLGTGMLNNVMEALGREHVVVDERKPDVIRVAPAPLYNTFQDCERFARVFVKACHEAAATQGS
ncbi:MAG: hypothetical protein Q9162_005304 [Coniocarpon cinnabarinum]